MNQRNISNLLYAIDHFCNKNKIKKELKKYKQLYVISLILNSKKFILYYILKYLFLVLL